MEDVRGRVLGTLGRVTPDRLSGRYEETWDGRTRIVDFCYRDPEHWRFEEDGQVTEVSNPTRTVVVKNGVGIAYANESVVVNNLIKSFIVSSKFIDDDFLKLIEEPVTHSSLNGRDIWVIHLAASHEKPSTVIRVDVQTGVFLSMEAGPRMAQLTNLDFDNTPPDSFFSWNGPTEERSG